VAADRRVMVVIDCGILSAVPGVRSTNMKPARSSPWLDERTLLLQQRLAEHDITAPNGVLRQLLSDHLDTTARLMRIGRQAAKVYVTDDVISKIADQLLGIDKADDHGNVISFATQRRKRR
jgi:hypothetical protein